MPTEGVTTRKYWIEVTSGDSAWLHKLLPEGDPNKRGLKAPARTKYLNLFERINPGDVVITYLTKELNPEKEWRSAFVGLSFITNRYRRAGHLIRIDTRGDVQFPIPVKLSEIKKISGLSPLLQRAIRMSMQSYLFEITASDLEEILSYHGENAHLLEIIGPLGNRELDHQPIVG